MLCLVVEERDSYWPSYFDRTFTDAVDSSITSNFHTEVILKWRNENRAPRVIQNENQPRHNLRDSYVITSKKLDRFARWHVDVLLLLGVKLQMPRGHTAQRHVG